MIPTVTLSYQEGPLDTIVGKLRPVEVVDHLGGLAGRITRGEIEGCERTGTFRFEPVGGAATQLGVRRMTARTVLGRLLRPTYDVTHGDGRWELKDLPGENILYFAVDGEVAGRRLTVREDWDGSVEVVARDPGGGKREVSRFAPGDVLTRTTVRIDEAALAAADEADGADPRGTALFGTLVLLPFLHRIYRQESSLVEELFFD